MAQGDLALLTTLRDADKGDTTPWPCEGAIVNTNAGLVNTKIQAIPNWTAAPGGEHTKCPNQQLYPWTPGALQSQGNPDLPRPCVKDEESSRKILSLEKTS